MKKFLEILVFIFLFSGNLLAGDSLKNMELTKDTGFGDLYGKSLTGNYYKDYGMQIVNKADDHPVRLGQESIRFEVQPGDCGADDPKHGDWIGQFIFLKIILMFFQLQLLMVNFINQDPFLFLCLRKEKMVIGYQ